ncbi:hypothetical protein LTR56_008390 [Elasticomyces elasticus]|nr:hypothetical protein LTR22_016729 [Elasticomyces elasticus]KAK3646626.1 hypothetical protein LTR56_008390 [Elasticomyces elasticus]KAK4913798.1 hypothetical protein LTR49_017946 [Elasticomyces elasticus]KAK5758009.1 hypothetical protein LTS12_011904 [Elasticomyces elasticus]
MSTSDDVKLAQYDSLVAEKLALKAELEAAKLVRQQGSSSERVFDVDSTAVGETASSEAQDASIAPESVMSLASAGETPGSDEQQAGSDLDSDVDAKSIDASSDGQDVTPSVHARYATSTIEQGVTSEPQAGGDTANTEVQAVASESGDVPSSLPATIIVSETEDERTKRIEREMEAAAQDEEEKERIYQETKRQQQEARAARDASRRQVRSILEVRAAEHLEEKRETKLKVGKVTGSVAG